VPKTPVFDLLLWLKGLLLRFDGRLAETIQEVGTYLPNASFSIDVYEIRLNYITTFKTFKNLKEIPFFK